MLLCHHLTLTAVTRTVSDLPGTHQRLKSRPPATAALAGLYDLRRGVGSSIARAGALQLGSLGGRTQQHYDAAAPPVPDLTPVQENRDC